MNLTKTQTSDHVIGIDLGTTNSCVSIWRNNKLEIIPDEYGNKTIPSVVAFTSKRRFVGKDAKNQMEINPVNSYYEVKRLIGKRFDNKSVQREMEMLSYKISGNEKGDIRIKSSFNKDKTYSPEEISAAILSKLKQMAEKYLKCSITKAVITVPAYFNDLQRQSTQTAATIAGLEVLRIINEPTAAALAYGMEKATLKTESDINVVVFDVGGGTLDVSLINIISGEFYTLGSTGNTHLGGADFDSELINYCFSFFKNKNSGSDKDINHMEFQDLSSYIIQELKNQCEIAKKLLSTKTKVHISIKNFFKKKDLFVTITRAKFTQICKHLLMLCFKPVDDLLISCEMDRDQIDEIILVGGLTRMPAIRDNVELFFGKKPNTTVNPDEVVSAGAAIQAYLIQYPDDPFSENVVMMDVIPLSLGVDTLGTMNVIIPRNTPIPTEMKKLYTVDKDFETSVLIQVYEGERSMSKDNFHIGEFIFSGLKSSPKFVEKIEITFSIDVNGIISVTARDIRSDNKKSIILRSNKGLSKKEIDKLIQDSEHYNIQDKIEQDKKYMYHQIINFCDAISLNIENESLKFSQAKKENIKNDINKVKKWILQKEYSEREREHYQKVINMLQKKYAILTEISTSSEHIKNVQGNNDSTIGTGVYDDNEDPSQISNALVDDIAEKLLEKEEFDCSSLKDLKNMKALKSELINTCKSIMEITNATNIILDKIDKTELIEYCDDTMLWCYAKQKISAQEYKNKIEEFNIFCDKILDKYPDGIYQLDDYVQNKKNQLEHLCYSIKTRIVSNEFSGKDSIIKKMSTTIDSILDWMIQFELKENSIKEKESGYEEKIDELNKICEELESYLLPTSDFESLDVDSTKLDEDILVVNNSGTVIK